jgi:very-short-patch-repair endonuclease
LPETLLWRELRARPGGYKFRRQHPAGVYVLDFYCASVRLAIEVDGVVHDSARASASDHVRSDFLKSQHVASLRVPAKAVLEDVQAVVERLVVVCEERAARMSGLRPMPLHHPTDGPPPRAGEDLS